MKRLTALLLLCALVLGGCAFLPSAPEKVTFYYVRRDYAQDMSSPIAPELRDAAGLQGNLSHLLSVYLMGPSWDSLSGPFSVNVRLQELTRTGETLNVLLTDAAYLLSDSEYSLGCACVALTLFDATDANLVVITSGSRTLSINRNQLIYQDVPPTDETEEPT